MAEGIIYNLNIMKQSTISPLNRNKNNTFILSKEEIKNNVLEFFKRKEISLEKDDINNINKVLYDKNIIKLKNIDDNPNLTNIQKNIIKNLQAILLSNYITKEEREELMKDEIKEIKNRITNKNDRNTTYQIVSIIYYFPKEEMARILEIINNNNTREFWDFISNDRGCFDFRCSSWREIISSTVTGIGVGGILGPIGGFVGGLIGYGNAFDGYCASDNDCI